MADLRELMTDAKRLYEALEDLTAKQDEIRKDDIDLKEIWQSAKNRPFKNHMLSAQEYSICRRYLGMLSCIVALSDDGKRRTVQIRFMARILSACYGATENDIRELLTDGMLLNEKGIEEFKELENKDLQTVLAVDMLILCYLCGEPEEKQLDFVVGFMAMLGLDRDTVKAIGTIAKGILEQDDSVVLGQVKYASVSQFFCYMQNPPEDTIIIKFISELKFAKADKVMFVNANISNEEDVINLDNYGKKKIIFYGCCFENIVGISAKETEVEFQNCKFLECGGKIPMLTINTGAICSTIFEECYFNKYGCKNESLIYISGVQMKNCKFSKCTISCCDTDNNRVSGQIVMATDSIIESNIFEECVASSRTSFTYDIKMDIISVIKSNVINNEFNKCSCSCSHCGRWGEESNEEIREYWNYILECDQYTSSKNNTFKECSSSQRNGDKYKGDKLSEKVICV